MPDKRETSSRIECDAKHFKVLSGRRPKTEYPHDIISQTRGLTTATVEKNVYNSLSVKMIQPAQEKKKVSPSY